MNPVSETSKTKTMVKSGFLQEANGNYSLMRLMGFFYLLGFAAIAIYSIWKGLQTGRPNTAGVYVGVMFLLAAVLGKNIQKIVEEKGETLYFEETRKRSGFLQEDNGVKSYGRLQSLGLCIISLVLGGITTYYGAIIENYQGDGTIFTLLATLGAICPKLLQKVVEENYGDILSYTKGKISDRIQK